MAGCVVILDCLKARTGAYQAAIEGNPELFSGARVLDVGCGTGILSLMSARAGAAQVIGVFLRSGPSGSIGCAC